MNTEKWKLMIEWFDEKTYSQLPISLQQTLKDFRKKNHYIDVLSNSISKDEREVKKLTNSIKERRDKIRIHKEQGKSLYQKLEPFKSQHEIDVYYSEGNRTKNVKTKVGINTHQYSQTNLKFKSQFLTNTKTINLKPKRRETLAILRNVCPKWYREVGESLISEKDKKKVKRIMVELFKPIVIELVQKNKKQFRDKDFSITFDNLIEVMKTKNL